MSLLYFLIWCAWISGLNFSIILCENANCFHYGAALKYGYVYAMFLEELINEATC